MTPDINNRTVRKQREDWWNRDCRNWINQREGTV